MKEKRPGLVEQPVFRVGIVLLAIILVFFVVQQMAVPKSFGEYGYFRGDNVQEQVEREANFSPGNNTCTSCHQDKQDTWGKAQHAAIACETCHGPAGKHAEHPGNLKPSRDTSREFCLGCHNKLTSRPQEVVRQVDGQKHNTGVQCANCHDPHQPWAKLGR